MYSYLLEDPLTQKWFSLWFDNNDKPLMTSNPLDADKYKTKEKAQEMADKINALNILPHLIVTEHEFIKP